MRVVTAATLPRRRLLVRGARGENSACLTFDDGPHPEHTPRVLDVLKGAGVPATFFVVGREAERHPDLVRRIAAEGHALGHHSFTHGDPAATSAADLIAEVRQTRALVSGIVGQALTLFRPPHGKLTALKLWGLWRERQTVVLWNVDPKDFARQGPEELRAWLREHPLRGGDIVLMHDNKPHAADALGELIETTRRRGLTFTTPPCWLR
jgi:peptidoglycan/xylan/chitin deacetylase (PgdA/CDA1 family)